jgi:pimeloyl-ACP methyl ester carboxylesterase
MLPLKLLARKGYPVIFYDQAGCGSSFIPKDLEKYP